MVIQRIQSLYLLIAAVMMCLFGFISPIVTTTSEVPAHFFVYHYWAILIPVVVVAILSIIDIFLYNTLKFQIRVASICAFLTLAVQIAFDVLCIFQLEPTDQPNWVAGLSFPCGAFLCLCLAIHGMKRDLKTLKSYDHFR